MLTTAPVYFSFRPTTADFTIVHKPHFCLLIKQLKSCITCIAVQI